MRRNILQLNVGASPMIISAFMMLVMWSCMTSHEASGAKILGIFPIPAKSHMSVNSALVKELANRGHQVTVLSPFPEKDPLPNYKDITVKAYTIPELLNNTSGLETNHFLRKDMSYFVQATVIWAVGIGICSTYLAEEPVQNLMRSEEQFDLILLESFNIDCFLGFVHKFKAPVIQLVAFGSTEVMGDLVGNPSPYSYVPDPFRQFSDRMSFTERLLNTIGQVFKKIGRKLFFVPKMNSLMRKHFHDENMPSVEELGKSTALLLINHHFSISSPRPMVPNFVQVGGMHVKPPKKLPADLQKFIDEAPEGVIYFSMGSNLKSTDMPETTVKAIIETFSSLKQRVLWKWEADSLPGQPANLKIQKWLPQSDILAHPNVRLFITHGGLLSTQETIHRGVPVIGIPIFGDQRLNMARAESLGFGLKLEFRNISKESFTWAIQDVLNNPKYRENAQRLSRIYRDQPLTPLEQAVFWTEYVIRHKGAHHMRSAALELYWFQYYLLDVTAVLMLAITIAAVTPLLILRRVCGGSQRKPVTSPKKKRN